MHKEYNGIKANKVNNINNINNEGVVFMLIGADIGRSHSKIAAGPNEADVITFPSYAMPGKNLEITTGTDPMNSLRVRINNEEWFIGELARREGGTREFDGEKGKHRNTLPLLITGIALHAVGCEEVNVCTGLPISDYQEQAIEFEEKIKGTYSVILPHKYVEIRIRDVITFPECLGMLWNQLLGSTGHINDLSFGHKMVGGIDIGWKTLNFGVIENMDYVSAMSGTLPIGLHKAFLAYYKRAGKDLTMAQAEKRFLIEGRPELMQLAAEIKDSLSPWWKRFDLFDEIYVGGGGGEKLIPYLNIEKAKLVNYPQTANARGFYKVARQNYD